MPHICADEILVIVMIVPFIGVAFKNIYVWYHKVKEIVKGWI
jgi:hypothetical protein